jgi:glycosyltransferase involved in cell wall biosynthesis
MINMSNSKNANSEVWLSICIPTYNRPLQLERMLTKLIPQITPGIEIIIRDDSEDQKTKVITEELLSQEGINYQYFSGPRMGVDSAAIFLLEKASGKYIWWFSDDDEIVHGAIAKVKQIVSKSDCTAIWANFTYDENGSLAVDRSSGPFASPDDALIALGTNVGLISTQIIRRESGINAVDFAKKHVHGFSFASTAIFLKSLGEGRSYFFRGPAIKCNPTEIDEIKKITSVGGRIINNGFTVYGEYFRNLIADLPESYSKMAKRRAISINFASLWRGMLVGWIGDWDTPGGKRLKMLKLYWSYPECWVALPLFCLPRPVVTIFYRIYKIFYSHRKFIFIDRLRVLWGK